MGFSEILVIFWSIFVGLVIGLGLFFIIYKMIKELSIKNKYYIEFFKGKNKDSLPLIRLKIRDKYRLFLIDTGANVNVLAAQALKHIMDKNDVLEIVGTDNVSGIGSDSKDDFKIVRETVSYNGEEFKEDFVIMDNWEEVRNRIAENCGKSIVGILGANFFEKHRWLLDFEKRVVWVNKNL